MLLQGRQAASCATLLGSECEEEDFTYVALTQGMF